MEVLLLLLFACLHRDGQIGMVKNANVLEHRQTLSTPASWEHIIHNKYMRLLNPCERFAFGFCFLGCGSSLQNVNTNPARFKAGIRSFPSFCSFRFSAQGVAALLSASSRTHYPAHCCNPASQHNFCASHPPSVLHKINSETFPRVYVHILCIFCEDLCYFV